MSIVDVKTNSLNIDLTKPIIRILEEIGEACAKDIEEKSPRRKITGGSYAKGWTYRQKGKDTVYVYNDGREKSLTHLLELGHLNKNGDTFVQPQEHIRPIYNKYAEICLGKMKNITMADWVTKKI